MGNISESITAKDLVEYFNPPISHFTRIQAGEMLSCTPGNIDRMCRVGIQIDGVTHKLIKLANGTIDYNSLFLIKKRLEKSRAARSN